MSQTAPSMARELVARVTAPSSRAAVVPTRVSATRTDIEALRALAILLVVAFHCRIPGVPGGFIGVDVFYVLSGYLITGLLVAEVQSTSRLSLLQFYARRVRRLLPAASLVLLVTLMAGTLVFAPQELHFAARAAAATSLYVSNMFFAKHAADYFAMRVASNPLLHTWSLAVEEQFYLFWPLLIMLALLVWHSRRVLVGMLIGLTALSLVASAWLTLHHEVLAFYWLPTRAWEFGIGGLAMLLPRGAVALPRGGWLALGWLGIALIAGSCMLLSASTPFPGWVALVPVLGTAIILVAGAELPHQGVGAWFDAEPLQRLGGLSYSWYLWHWPFLVFAAALFPAVSTFGKTIAGVLALAVAHYTHRYFENPIRFSPYLQRRPGLSLAIGGGAAATCLVAALMAARFADDLAATPQMQTLAAADRDIAALSRRHCMGQGSSSAVQACSFGADSAATNIVLFGDSHAIQWFDPVKQLAQQHDWKLTTVVKLGCAAIDISPAQGVDSDRECIQWRTEALQRIIELKPTLVLLSSATNRLERPDDPTIRASPAYVADLREQASLTLSQLSRAGLRVALIRDTPEFPFDVATCLARSERHSWSSTKACEMPRAAVLDPAVYEAEKSAARGLSNVHLIDMTADLCPQGLCRATLNGLPMYRDSHHLTGRFTTSLEPEIETQVLAALRR